MFVQYQDGYINTDHIVRVYRGEKRNSWYMLMASGERIEMDAYGKDRALFDAITSRLIGRLRN